MPENRKRFSILNPQSSILIPRAGWYFLLFALLPILFLGVIRRINLLLLLGDVLVVMALLNLLAAGWSLRGLRARRRLGDWLFARTPCSLEVQVSNPGRRPCLGLRLEQEGPDQAATWYIDWLPARDSVSWRRQVMLPRRGRYTWGAIEAVSGYPFGLVERRRPLTLAETAIVLPRLGWLHRGRFLRYLRDLSVQPQRVHLRRKPRSHPAAQAEFHGLRLYRSGDSPRLIHWRTSARRGELMVREFEDEPSDNLLVIVDPTLPPESDYCGVPLRDEFEEAISLAASICWEWCRRRGDKLVLATATANPTVWQGLTGPEHARRVLECLALLECDVRPADLTVLARLQAQRLPPALAVIVAVGPSTLADPLARALGRRVYCLDATQSERFDFYTQPT
jgi:uncharacterized protein (DUF58 family)